MVYSWFLPSFGPQVLAQEDFQGSTGITRLPDLEKLKAKQSEAKRSKTLTHVVRVWSPTL